jgi:hypothetical protein
MKDEGNASGNVRIVYHRSGFESSAGHQVRSKLEASVCEWLMRNRIAHRHGSEIFTVRIGGTGVPTVYVPDIVLHDHDAEGRTVIIEPFDATVPRVGSTHIIAAFRREMAKNYVIIIVAKRMHAKKILKEAYDVLIDSTCLEDLEAHLPLPPD